MSRVKRCFTAQSQFITYFEWSNLLCIIMNVRQTFRFLRCFPNPSKDNVRSKMLPKWNETSQPFLKISRPSTRKKSVWLYCERSLLMITVTAFIKPTWVSRVTYLSRHFSFPRLAYAWVYSMIISTKRNHCARWLAAALLACASWNGATNHKHSSSNSLNIASPRDTDVHCASHIHNYLPNPMISISVAWR